MEAALRNTYKYSWSHEDMIVELSKGYQVTIPAEVRNELNLKPGSKFIMRIRGEVIQLQSLAQGWQDFWDEIKEDAKKHSHNLTPEELDDFSELY